MKYAGFWIRFWATIIDSLIWSPMVLIVVFLINVMNVSRNDTAFITVVVLVINQILAWLYSALFESGGWQATPGKRLLGLRVTGLNGDRISFGRASGRYFSKLLSILTFYIGYIMAGLTENKQGLHDMVAGTLVLRGKADGASAHIRPTSDFRDDTVAVTVAMSHQSTRWVMAGFDDNGHVVRLSFNGDDPLLDHVGLFIGRDSKSCDLYINDQSVSRRHGRLFKEHGKLRVEDMRSTNGILINGRLVPKGQSAELPSQGNITVGAVELSIGKY